MKDSFQIRTDNERLAFLNLYDRVKEKFKDYDIIYNLISNNNYGSLDVLLHIYDKEGQKVASHIYEIKIRDNHYHELLLEKKKYDYLKKYKEKEEKVFPSVKIFYVNFTPKGTYIFDLDKVKTIWEYRRCNRQTVNKTGKINKIICLLNTHEATQIDMVVTREMLESKRNKYNNIIKEENKQKCIFDSLNNFN